MKITVIKIVPNEKPELVEIENNLHSLQKEVNGYIEAIYPWEDPVALICNEEGKVNGEPLNRFLYSDDGNVIDVIAGTFLVAGLTKQNFGSIGEYAEKYMDIFKRPHPLPFCKVCSRPLGVLIGNKIYCSSNYEGTNICRVCREKME